MVHTYPGHRKMEWYETENSAELITETMAMLIMRYADACDLPSINEGEEFANRREEAAVEE